MIGVIGDVKNYVFFFKLLSRSRFPLVRFELSRVALGSSMIFWPVRHILRVSQVLGCELSKEGAKRHGLEKEWMTGPINCAPLSHCWPLRPARCCGKIQEVVWKVGDQLHVPQHDLSNLGGHLSEKGKHRKFRVLVLEGYHIFVTNLLTSIQAQPVQICFSFHPEKLQSVRLSSHCFMFVWLLKYLDRAQQARQQGPASGGQLGLNPTSQCRHDMEYHESRGASHVSWGHVFSGHQINRHEPDSWLLGQKCDTLTVDG